MGTFTVSFGHPRAVIQATVESDIIGNCGIAVLKDVSCYPLAEQPIEPEICDAAYKALAETLNGRGPTNYIFSDNILKVGTAYPKPRITMDDVKISTGGFAAYLIRTGYGRISCSHRMANRNHRHSLACSIIQLWTWTPPSSREGVEKDIVASGYVKKEWLRGRERIFKTPEELKNLQPVSTKW